VPPGFLNRKLGGVFLGNPNPPNLKRLPIYEDISQILPVEDVQRFFLLEICSIRSNQTIIHLKPFTMKKPCISLFLIMTIGILFLTYGCSEDRYEQIGDEIIEVEATESAFVEGNETPHVCIDKFVESGKGNHGNEKTAGITPKLWNIGQTIRVRFLGGDAYVQDKVIKYAKVWEEFANLHFQFVTSGPAEIRVAFQSGGSWSYMGTDALLINANSATMNFGWFNQNTSETEFSRTTLHEFGHALGLIHEHQHSISTIPWDSAAVYNYYMAPPNNWTRAQVNSNLFGRYSSSQTQYCLYDQNSIMHYAVPNELTIGNFEVGWNTKLSKEDKAFMTRIYPFSGSRISNDCRPSWFIATGGASNWQKLRTLNAALRDLAFADFNGDGRTDVFRTNSSTGQWEVSLSGSGEWQRLQTSNVPLNQLAFGDFNGDGKTDVFRTNNGRWEVSYTGLSVSIWQVLNNNSTLLPNLRFGDFNGDGKTDVFTVSGSSFLRSWQVSYGGTTPFQNLNSSIGFNGPAINELAFGDFNGDGKTDVFRSNTSTTRWEVSYGGTGTWQFMYSNPPYNVSSFGFADFNGDGKTDVLFANGTNWLVSYGAKTALQPLRASVQTRSELAFGDFNGDGKADVFNIQ
jgi:serralysin